MIDGIDLLGISFNLVLFVSPSSSPLFFAFCFSLMNSECLEETVKGNPSVLAKATALWKFFKRVITTMRKEYTQMCRLDKLTCVTS